MVTAYYVWFFDRLFRIVKMACFGFRIVPLLVIDENLPKLKYTNLLRHHIFLATIIVFILQIVIVGKTTPSVLFTKVSNYAQH